VNMNLPVVSTQTGEENDDCIYKQRARVYRLRKGEWKERGTGDAKLLRNKESKKIRFLLRQEKTLKVAANFYLAENPFCELVPMASSDKAFTWVALDYSEEKPTQESLAVRFGTAEQAQKFLETWEAGRKFNKTLKDGGEPVFAPVVEDEAPAEKKVEESKEEKKEEKKEDKKEEKAKVEDQKKEGASEEAKKE